MRTAVYVTGVGNVAFAACFLKTFYDTTMWTRSNGYIFYVGDTTSGCDLNPVVYLFAPGEEYYPEFLSHTGRGGCNALWTQCVRHAAGCGFDLCICCNDDIMFPRAGWLEAIVRIFQRNPHVAMVGIGSDSVWEKEHHHRERWFTDPSLLVEAAEHCEAFRETPVRYVHHVAGPCWACRPELWLEAGGIPEELFWGWGEIVPCIELRKMGYQSVAVQFPTTILHWGGGSEREIHSDPARHESFTRRSKEMGDEGAFITKKYGCGHAHLMAKAFDESDKIKHLPPLLYEPPSM